jgi:hypothetical protein
MKRHRLILLVPALLGLALLAPAAARAATAQLTAPADGIDWTAGTVTVAADYPAGTTTVAFTANDLPLGTVTVADPAVAGTVSSGVPYSLTAATAFRAESLDALGASLSVATLELTPAMFTPSSPRLELGSGAIVAPSITIEAVSNRTVTRVVVSAGPERLAGEPKLVSGADGRIELADLRVPYGIERLQLIASNGFGSSARSRGRVVFSLGPSSKLPQQPSYVLVDKRSMTLYDVRQRRVVRHYDIAIGTPSTPTPNGYFKIGSAQPASGSWGVMRRPLYEFSRTKLWPSGFYIHGTNAPWDIGTWASHGCVRLYNWAIRTFTRTVPNGTLVLIRK